MSLAEPGDRNPYRILAVLNIRRVQKFREEQIAVELGFDSLQDMRDYLRALELPDWVVLGPRSHDEQFAGGRKVAKRKGKQKNRTVGGPVQELPPSKEAAPLFTEALEKLRRLLDELVYLQSGPRRTPEYLQDGRFVQDTREEAPAWAPDIGGRTRIAGATQAPGNGLTQLIAAYLLAGGDAESLIEKLHYKPENLDREKLDKVLGGDKATSSPGLFRRAMQAARLIRGADGKDGRWPSPFDVDELSVRHRILGMRAAGLEDEQILEALSAEGVSIEGAPISRAQLKYLAELGLPDPPV